MTAELLLLLLSMVVGVVERVGAAAAEAKVEAEAEAEAGAEAPEGLSILTLLGEGEPDDERKRLIVVEGVDEDGPTRGEGGRRSRGELLCSVAVVLRPGEGGRARNVEAAPEQLESGRIDQLALPDLTFSTRPSCSRKLFAELEHWVEANVTRMSFGGLSGLCTANQWLIGKIIGRRTAATLDWLIRHCR